MEEHEPGVVKRLRVGAWEEREWLKDRKGKRPHVPKVRAQPRGWESGDKRAARPVCSICRGGADGELRSPDTNAVVCEDCYIEQKFYRYDRIALRSFSDGSLMFRQVHSA